MNINSENKQLIHDALIIDMQKRLREDGKGIMFTNDNEYTVIIMPRALMSSLFSFSSPFTQTLSTTPH